MCALSVSASTTATSPLAYQRPDLTVVAPQDEAAAAQLIREASAAGQAILARGGGSKWCMGRFPEHGGMVLSATNLRGILEYEPGELTFTARAGTPLAEIQAALAANGQYLPFDPPFAASGATLGGTIAAGLSGPRRMRYGGLRDFVIGIAYLNPRGDLVHSGGKVVKNAAGYDFSKLFCGSLGTLGVLTQASFKVFPAPQAQRTVLVGLRSIQDVQSAFVQIQRSTLEVSGLEAWPAGTIPGVDDLGMLYTLAVNLDGVAASFDARTKVLQKLLPTSARITVLSADTDAALWTTVRDVTWIGAPLPEVANASTVLRLYLPPTNVAALDGVLSAPGANWRRVYSVGGNLACAATSESGEVDLTQLGAQLQRIGVRAAVWRTPTPSHNGDILPALPGASAVQRIKRAFDPDHLFYPGRYAGV